MPFTRDELDSFHRFASARLDNGGIGSIEDCLRQWRAVREEEEAIADIEEGLKDIEAGRVHTLAEVEGEIRGPFGFGSRDKSA